MEDHQLMDVVVEDFPDTGDAGGGDPEHGGAEQCFFAAGIRYWGHADHARKGSHRGVQHPDSYFVQPGQVRQGGDQHQVGFAHIATGVAAGQGADYEFGNTQLQRGESDATQGGAATAAHPQKTVNLPRQVFSVQKLSEGQAHRRNGLAPVGNFPWIRSWLARKKILWRDIKACTNIPASAHINRPRRKSQIPQPAGGKSQLGAFGVSSGDNPNHSRGCRFQQGGCRHSLVPRKRKRVYLRRSIE